MKIAIKRGISEPPSYYTTLSRKILDFCVTRWTVRANSLISIDVNHLGLITLFVTIMSDREERSNLDAEKTRDIVGMIAYMQKFEFICGIKLSILIYVEVDNIAKHIQGDKVSISNTIQFAK